MTPEFIDKMTPDERDWYYDELVDLNARISKKIREARNRNRNR